MLGSEIQACFHGFCLPIICGGSLVEQLIFSCKKFTFSFIILIDFAFFIYKHVWNKHVTFQIVQSECLGMKLSQVSMVIACPLHICEIPTKIVEVFVQKVEISTPYFNRFNLMTPHLTYIQKFPPNSQLLIMLVLESC